MLAAGLRAQAPVAVALTLEAGRSTFQTGEKIALRLMFTASTAGYMLNNTVTEPASPLDKIVISPEIGVSRWLEERARGHRYVPDYASMVDLEPGKPQTITLALNDVVRFEEPGHYSVQISTDRLFKGPFLQLEAAGALVTNAVEIDIEPMSEDEDAARAKLLETEIRASNDGRAVREYLEELDDLTGAGSTAAKLSLFLRPKVLDGTSFASAKGLWIARDRALVAARLEEALRDPKQEASYELVRIASELKAALDAPYDPRTPEQASDKNKAEVAVLHELAETLPSRQGKSLVGAAQTLLVRLGELRATTNPDFEAAREVLITHFDQVADMEVEWLLDAYGKYLVDARLVTALEQILARTQFPANRIAVQKQLDRILAGPKEQ